MSRPTLYQFAGGEPAFRALAEAQYKRCLADPVLSQVFGTTADPEHAGRLAAWLGEVFGGPPVYTERYGGHEGMISSHLGGLFTEPQRARFVEVTLEAADEVGLPSDHLFRERFRAYFEWGSRLAVVYSQPGATLPQGEPSPRWDWDSPAVGLSVGSGATGAVEQNVGGHHMSNGPGKPSFGRDIKPLFRDRDVRSMAFVFDLRSYDDVVAHHTAILARLEAGTMPCDGPWPADHLTLFRSWVAAGSAR